jgi:hemerythrin-like domain-containing protein
MDPAKLHDFAKKLSAHIRKEERELFETLQRLLAPEELESVGRSLANALNATGSDQNSCNLPNHATRLRSRKEIDKG